MLKHVPKQKKKNEKSPNLQEIQKTEEDFCQAKLETNKVCNFFYKISYELKKKSSICALQERSFSFQDVSKMFFAIVCDCFKMHIKTGNKFF